MDTRLRGDITVLASQFTQLTAREQLAPFLGVSWERLYFLAYSRQARYRIFEVKKRRGGVRLLAEPITGLKIIQQKLNQIFYALYRPREGVHGYVPNRSVASNAQAHEGRRWVLNIDLQDFFPTIHFGRIRGMLMAAPYKIHPDVATIVAQLCTNESKLPQGAPTSPILSNMVCASLDAALLLLARRSRAVYSRYADDITFSTDLAVVSSRLVVPNPDYRSPRLAQGLVDAVITNGFTINESKVRLRSSTERQIVTGLVVNQFPNVPRTFVREVRAMLHDWESRGLEAAAARFRDQFDHKDRGPFKPQPLFSAVVKGRIDYLGMVRGKANPIYKNLLRKYAKLDQGYLPVPAHRRRPNHLRSFRDSIWVLETKTDTGTMFYLEDIGWVTCDHVCGEQMVGFHPDEPELRWPVQKLIGDKDMDLAIVNVGAPPVYAFKASKRKPVLTGDMVKLTGFPHYAPGATLWEDIGQVVGHRHAMGYPRIMINVAIITGVSGGPVLDNRNHVIGVAATGGEDVHEAKVRNLNSVIPIVTVQKLWSKFVSAPGTT
jgi:RNA-directed DNA polymerase